MPAAVLVHYRLMARYNQCLNERLYNACEKLTDADREITPALHPDRANLKHSRESLDAAIEASVPDMPPIFLLGLLRYTNTRRVAREHPAWQALLHFFNHQTHPRGQVTTLLTQAGVDVGVAHPIALASSRSE